MVRRCHTTSTSTNTNNASSVVVRFFSESFSKVPSETLATKGGLQSCHSPTKAPPTATSTPKPIGKALTTTSPRRTSPAVRSRSLSASNTKQLVSRRTRDRLLLSGLRLPADVVIAQYSQRALPSRWSWISTHDGKVIYVCSARTQWEVHSDIHPLPSSFVDLPLRRTAAPLGELPQGYTGIIDPSGMVHCLSDQRVFGETRLYTEYLETHCTDINPRTLQPSQVLKRWPEHKELSLFDTPEMLISFLEPKQLHADT